MTGRRYVALDLETTGLDRWPTPAKPLEIAAVLIDPPTRAIPVELSDLVNVLDFVPHHTRIDLFHADQSALSVNRYFERRLWEHKLTMAETTEHAEMLAELLDGAIVVGANVDYDLAILWPWLRERLPSLDAEPWHFRKFDLGCTTQVAHNLPEPASLKKACEMWGVINMAPHTALGDARAAAAVFGEIRKWASGEPYRALVDEAIDEAIEGALPRD